MLSGTYKKGGSIDIDHLSKQNIPKMINKRIHDGVLNVAYIMKAHAMNAAVVVVIDELP